MFGHGNPKSNKPPFQIAIIYMK